MVAPDALAADDWHNSGLCWRHSPEILSGKVDTRLAFGVFISSTAAYRTRLFGISLAKGQQREHVLHVVWQSRIRVPTEFSFKRIALLKALVAAPVNRESC